MPRVLTEYETLCLRAFQRQVGRLRKSRIVQQAHLHLKVSTKLTFGSGEVVTTVEGYDPEAFQAQMPILRQFLLQEPVNFNHIHNIVNQCCDRSELVEWVRYAKGKWDARLASLPGEVHRHFHQVGLSVDEAMQKLFYGYGGLFHVDINDPKEDDSVRAIQEGMLHYSFPYLFWCLNVYDSAINWWLDATTEPVPAVPKT